MSVVRSIPTLRAAADSVVAAIRSRLAITRGTLVVAIDGGSGAGKSTLASEVAKHLDAVVIHCDDFFSATVTEAQWDRYTPDERYRRCIDWQRVRVEVLEPLLAGRAAQYHPYSFATEDGLAVHWVRKEPAQVIILDGIYSALPDLADIVHLTILVDASPEIRRQRHNLREGDEDLAWHARWGPAERYYLSMVRPAESFDLVVVI